MITYDHTELLIRLSPTCFDLSEGTNYRLDLGVWAGALDRAWAQVIALYGESFPSSTAALIASWEVEYDVRQVRDKTLAQRRDAVLAHHRFLPDLTPATITAILETLLDLDVVIVEPFAFRCDDADSVCDDAGDTLDAYIFFVELDEEAARLADHSRDEVAYYVELLKPAHTLGIIRCDDFRCDDAWSLCDFDSLGA